MGFNVFYHDYDGYCSRFAKQRFQKRNLTIQSFSPNDTREFDYVICFEVAEHVPNPPELVAELSKLTAPDGYCIFSESFGLLKPIFPTHLASNLKYVGKADELFKQHKMNVAWRDEHDKPIVYTKLPVPPKSKPSVFSVAKRVGRRIKRELQK
jgi:SAM-dependent methyltransferase